MDCPFCKIITSDGGKDSADSDRILHETEYSIVILSNPRLMPGHMLVIPKRHVEKLSELAPAERSDLLDQAIRLQGKIIEKLAPGCDISQHYRPFIPNNRFKVSHLHIHLRPRMLNDELYEKVQIHEHEVFEDLPAMDAIEIEKYKELFDAASLIG